MWRAEAVCANPKHDPELWFSTRTADKERAKFLCRTCPVALACLTDTLDYEAMTNETRHGIHGGLDESERRQFARRQKRRQIA